MKRKYAGDGSGVSKRTRKGGSYGGNTSRPGGSFKPPPRTTYRGSRVPLASRGYKPNTVEKKVFDIDSATYAANTTGSVTTLFIPTLGSDMTNRVGRKTTVKSLYVRGFLQVEASQSTWTSPLNSVPQQARLIIAIDMQPNGAAPAISDVLKESTKTQSQLNINNRDRFKILSDKTYVLGGAIYNTTATQAVASQNDQIKQIKIFKKLNLETIFNGTNGGTVADINSGSLFMLTLGNIGAGSGVDADFFLSTRVRFVDI